MGSRPRWSCLNLKRSTRRAGGLEFGRDPKGMLADEWRCSEEACVSRSVDCEPRRGFDGLLDSGEVSTRLIADGEAWSLGESDPMVV